MSYLLRKNEKVYHGSFWSCEKNFPKPFNTLDVGLARDPDAGVQFVTDDPSVAKNFSEDSVFGIDTKKYKHVILSGKVPRDLNLFDLEKDEVCHPNLSAYLEDEDQNQDKIPCIKFSKFIEADNDPMDIYQFIDESKYDGAFHIAVDSKGNDYNDFALFKPEEIVFDKVEIIDPKDIANNEGEEMPFERAAKVFSNFCKIKPLDIWMKK